jgi:hypothetical protein
MLHAIPYQGRIQMVLPYLPDGCTSIACNFHNKDWCPNAVALMSERLQFFSMSCFIKDSVWTVAAIFSYLCLRRKSFYLSNTDWHPDGIATSFGRMYFEHWILLEL